MDRSGEVVVTSTLHPIQVVKLSETAAAETARFIKVLNAIETISKQAEEGDWDEYETRRIFATFMVHRVEWVLKNAKSVEPWMRMVLRMVRDNMRRVADLPPADI